MNLVQTATCKNAFHLGEKTAKILTLFSIYQIIYQISILAKVNYLHFRVVRY